MATTQSWRRARVSQVERARWSLPLELLPNRPPSPVSSMASRTAARSPSSGASSEPASSRCARASTRSFLFSSALPCGISPSPSVFVSSSGFQLRQRFFSHVARKGFRFGKGVPLSLFGFAS